jgi:hypothetical protein
VKPQRDKESECNRLMPVTRDEFRKISGGGNTENKEKRANQNA